MKFHIVIERVFILACLGISQVTADEEHEHRHHESHEHGVAELNLAVDGSSVLIELESPAVNIVGFEHKPQNKAEQDQVEQAINQLKQAKALFLFTSDANCHLDAVEVETELQQDHEQHDHDHHESDVEHSEFSVNYTFSCDSIEKLEQVEVTLFQEFNGIESITGQLITTKSQGFNRINSGS